MAMFELTAKHNIFLDSHNIINKGERIQMHFGSPCACPGNILINPESRRQAIQQFNANGIDASRHPNVLNICHWDIKKAPTSQLYKSTEPMDSFKGIFTPWNDNPKHSLDVIDDVDMKKECIDLVREFHSEGFDMDYAEKGIEGRCEIASSFYDEVKRTMGIDAELSFADMPPYYLGGYNPTTNKIELNANYLEKTDCRELLNTLLHESRHAFQNKCVLSPDSVTVKNNIIDVWKDNMENYISPEFDQEAYENQEIEKDANYFADSVMNKGANLYYA